MRKYKFIQRTTTRHGRVVYYFQRGKGARVRLPDAYGTQQFWDAYFEALAGKTPVVVNKTAREMLDARMRAILGRSLELSRQRARSRKKAFDLTIDWLLATVRKQKYRCALTALPLDLGKMHRNPFGPSLDRIDCAGGYTQDNVRVVAMAVNIMLSDWGESVLEKVAKAYLANKSGSPIVLPRDNRSLTGKYLEQHQGLA